MSGHPTVTAEGDLSSSTDSSAEPGVILAWCGRAPRHEARALVGGAVVLGRGDDLDDERLSRRHAELRHARGVWTVRDLGSRNGTSVDGVDVDGEITRRDARVVRMGNTIALLVADLGPARARPLRIDGDTVAGPALRAALAVAERAAASGSPLLIHGESGTGKELAARAFHAAGPRRRGPFVAVNCATIPAGLAERLLFGARRGAFSGADADVEGYLQAAHGGVLFLDEIAELDPAVQPKLLRAVEAGEVLPLGATAARRVDVLPCFATHQDLRGAVAAGRFRADLYYRIARAELALPPLRQRLEEIPWLVACELEAAGLDAHAAFVEACLLRRWPGNVRELRAAVRAAADRALADDAGAVRRSHLAAGAGQPLDGAPAGAPPGRDDVEAALAAAGGNVSAAARSLGLHRTQLYRALKKHGRGE